MTEAEKIEVKAALNSYCDLLYNQLVTSIEAAEAELPGDIDDNQRHMMVTNIIKSTFENQQAVIKKGFDEVNEKLKDKDFINKVREDLNGRS